MLANVNLVKDFDALARYGRIVVIGSRGALEFEPRLTMRIDASILGMSLVNASADELRRAYVAIGAGLDNGSLRPLIGRELALAEAARAHREIMEPGSAGKIVLVP
jgi:NADPH2:quinone reductase